MLFFENAKSFAKILWDGRKLRMDGRWMDDGVMMANGWTAMCKQCNSCNSVTVRFG